MDEYGERLVRIETIVSESKNDVKEIKSSIEKLVAHDNQQDLKLQNHETKIGVIWKIGITTLIGIIGGMIKLFWSGR